MSEHTYNYKLSLYKSLTIMNESDKSKVELVKDIRSNKIYIKKTLTNYNLQVYKQLQKINFIGLPKILEIINSEKELVIIEEFINGKTLDELLNEGILSEELVINYMIKLCDILDIIHNLDNPIIHRDIKPSNIIIDNSGNLKLIDFDVSRVHKELGNRDTQILGTEGYASPEQFGFDQTNPRSDIYAVGILMNVLTTGKFPRETKNNGKLKNIIGKCTRISPEERYSSVKELKIALTKCKGKDISKNKEFNYIRQIPGFRKGNILYAIIASLWYLLLIVALTSNLKKGDLFAFFGDLVMVVGLLIITFIYTNFNDIQSQLPLLKEEMPSKRIAGFILYTILIILIAGALLGIFQ